MSSTLTDMAAEMVGHARVAKGADPARIIANRIAASAVALPDRRVSVSFDDLRDLMTSVGLHYILTEVDPG